MMDVEVKAKWLEALRSDNFTQGKFELRTEKGCNCCLGVLAEINNIRREDSTFNGSRMCTNYYFPSVGEDDVYDASVPNGFCGLSETAINTLINLNDGGVYDDEDNALPPKTFSEIADFIEEKL